MDRSIGIRELKNRASALVDDAEHGATVTITRRGRPVARLVPIGPPTGAARLVESGRARWSGGKPALPAAITLRGAGPTAAEQVAEDRGPR